jgi:hypothetical protein
MRKLYTSPEMEIIEFDTKDVITTSGINGFGDSANSDVDAEGNLIKYHEGGHWAYRNHDK